jgi:hypothetical protein
MGNADLATTTLAPGREAHCAPAAVHEISDLKDKLLYGPPCLPARIKDLMGLIEFSGTYD